ncbi:MAG: hypothetical protein ABI741_01135 [Ferruginibacter sp.]
MTNNSPLEEHIKEKFGNYSPDVPPHIWENIIAKKDKRRPGAFWFSFLNKNILLLLFVIVSAGAGILIYKNVYSPVEHKKIVSVNDPSNTSIEKINNEVPGTDDKTATNIATGTKINDNPASSNISLTETSTNKAGPIVTAPGKSSVAAGKDPASPGYKDNLPALGADNDNNNQSSTAVTYTTTKNSLYKKPKTLKGSATIIYKTPDATTDDLSETASNELLLKRLLLELEMIRAEKTFTISVKKINNPHLDIPCPEAEKNAAGNKKYFELYGGPDYAFRSITDTGNSAYMQKRKESTSFSSAFSVGLRYTRVFGNGMSFRTGINYSQINEKFKFAQGNIVQVVYIINTNGDTTGSYTTTGTRYKTTYNKFRTIDVPILVGYELGNGRIHANFNAGAIVNLYSWQKGDVLDTAYQPVSITTGKANSPYQFKTNVGIGFIGAISVYYKLTEKWHLFAEPYFRYNFSPASKSDLTLKQKYNTAGLRLGIRLDF